MIRRIDRIEKDSKTKRVKILYTLKPKHFSEDSNISEESFKNLYKKLADINHTEFEADILGLKVHMVSQTFSLQLGSDILSKGLWIACKLTMQK